MPIRVNLKEIFPSDPQEITVDKVNFNFNKLLELGIGTPGPIGLTGPQGPAGPIGLTGPQGDRGATWWVDSGDPNTLTFTGLIDGDLYLDQDSNAFQVYQYDDSTGTWTPIVSIAAIVNTYLASLSTIPFEAVPTTQLPGTTTVNKFILFDERAFGSDSVRGTNNTSQNNILFLNNFNELDISPSGAIANALGQGQYNSLLAIYPDHSDATLSSNAEVGRYHIDLGSLYTPDNSVTKYYSNIKHNLKIKFYKRDLTVVGPHIPSTNTWINTARFSLSVTENETVADIDENSEFEFVFPKWNNEGMSPIREQLTVRLSSAEAAVEQGSAFTHIVADGIHIAKDPSLTNPLNLNASIGLALDFSSLNPKLSGKTHLMLDANSGVNGVILLNKDTFINGELDVAGPIITSGNSGLPSSVSSSPILAGNFGTPNIGRLYIGNGTGWRFHFSSRDSSINNDLVTFQDNGSVGVGISVPTAKVHINNNTPSDSFRVDDAASPDTSPFIITQTGAVGIGTDSPTTKLHINGTFRLDSSPVANSFLRGDASGNGTWSAITNIGVPVGAVMPYFGTTAPDGWLLCSSIAVYQWQYPVLYNHLVANGQGSFGSFPNNFTRTPNLNDKFIVGAGTTYSLMDIGGAATVALTRQQLAKHTHKLDNGTDGAVMSDPGNHTHTYRYVSEFGEGDGAGDNSGSFSTGNTGEAGAHTHTGNTGDGTSNDVGLGGTAGNGAPHENLPPYYALAYIMKT